MLLEGWFPGLKRELVDAGASDIDHGDEVGWLGHNGWAARFDRGAAWSLWASRSLTDSILRRRLREDSRVTWRSETRATALVLDAAKKRVTGVRTEAGETLEADLVIDRSRSVLRFERGILPGHGPQAIAWRPGGPLGDVKGPFPTPSYASQDSRFAASRHADGVALRSPSR